MQIADLNAVFNEVVKPGFKINAMIDSLSDNIIIRVYNINTSIIRRHYISSQVFMYNNKFKVINGILNELAMLDDCIYITPNYIKNFAINMDAILNNTFKLGKLY